MVKLLVQPQSFNVHLSVTSIFFSFKKNSTQNTWKSPKSWHYRCCCLFLLAVVHVVIAFELRKKMSNWNKVVGWNKYLNYFFEKIAERKIHEMTLLLCHFLWLCTFWDEKSFERKKIKEFECGWGSVLEKKGWIFVDEKSIEWDGR